MSDLIARIFPKYKITLIVSVLILISTLMILGVATGIINQQIGSLLLQSIGVVASTFLAVVTWFTLRQNRQLIEQQEQEAEQTEKEIERQGKEIERQRQQPLYQDIVILVNGFVDDLSDNREGLIDELSDWSGDSEQLKTLVLEDQFTPRADIDPVSRVRLKEEQSELYRELVEHDQLIWEIEEQVRKARRELRGPIGGYLDEVVPLEENTCLEKQVADYRQRSNDIDNVVNGLLNFYHRWGKEIETELWVNHQSNLGTIAEDNAEEEIDELLELEQRYCDASHDLLEAILSLRNKLQTEYGISITELQPEQQRSIKF